MKLNSNVLCPHCTSRLVGLIEGHNRFFCSDCCVEFELQTKNVVVYNVTKDGTAPLLYREERATGVYKLHGVYFSNKDRVWIAAIYYNKKRIHIGRYKDAKSAAIEYNKTATKLLGDCAKLNDLSVFN